MKSEYAKPLFFYWVIVISILVNANTLSGQSCSHIDRNAWTWPGHNNWFFSSKDSPEGVIYNQRKNTKTNIYQSNYSLPMKESTSIRAYEGTTAASDDQGNLIFFSNGRKAWRPDGTLITDKLLEGNECGGMDDRGSASQGVITVRHPLDPTTFYIIAVDDIVNAVCPRTGPTVARIDSAGNLIENSVPIDQYIGSSTRVEGTTEGITATLHENGVDIWITVQILDSRRFHSYLLTCDGFVSEPVISDNVGESIDVMMGSGGLAFSWDGTMLGAIHNGPIEVKDKVNLYDFDNSTGKITNRKKVGYSANAWASRLMYDIIFSTDNSKMYWTSYETTRQVDVTSGNEVQIDTYVYKIYYSMNQPSGVPEQHQKVGIVNVIK